MDLRPFSLHLMQMSYGQGRKLTVLAEGREEVQALTNRLVVIIFLDSLEVALAKQEPLEVQFFVRGY